MEAKESWNDTPPWMAGGRQDMAAVFATRGSERLPVIGEIDVRLAHWLPAKPAEEHAPYHPFDKLS